LSLASLTVDLIANLSKFEGDSGKAAQIIARDGEKMSRSQQAFLKSLERTAERMEGIGASSLRVRAAIVGVSDAAEVFLTRIDAAGGAAARAGTQGAAAFTALQSTVAASIASQKAGYSELAESINKVNAEAKRLKESAASDNKSGVISDDLLKTRLANISAGRADAIRQLRESDAQQAAERAIADVAKAAAADRAESARKITDAQKGLTASYREQLAALRELRDAGNLTPAQFRQAGTELVNKQPVRQQAARDAAASQATSNSNAAFLSSLEQQASFAGKTRAEILALQAAQRGLGKEAEAAIAKIAAFDAKTGQLGKSAFASRNQLLTLQYTISDVVASAGSGISPLTILLQQGGQVYDAFAGQGGIRAGISAVTGIFTPFRVAVLSGVGALGLLGAAFFKGSAESKAFADAIVLSGNAAGLTEGRFKELAANIAESGQVTQSAAREYALALAATGEIGPKSFDKAAEAAAKFGAATGKSAKDVASQFASLTRDVSAGAADLNKSLNFLTAAQLQQIRSLQDNGKAADALGIVYGALSTRLDALEPNLTTLDGLLRAGANAWDTFWTAAKDATGGNDTVERKLQIAKDNLISVQQRLAAPRVPVIGALFDGGNRAELNLAANEVRKLQIEKNVQDAAAQTAAANVELDRKAGKADEFVRGFEVRAKSVAALNRAIEEAKNNFKAQDERAKTDPNYKPSDAATRAQILEQIKKDFTPAPERKPRKDREPDQILKAERDQALKEYENQLQAERVATDFQQKYLQGVYDAGAISLRDFYDKRRAVTETSLAAELSALEKSIGAEETFLTKSKDPSDRIAAQTKINDFRDQQTAARIAGARAITLANQQEEASLKALNDRVIEYSAQLKQLEGDEAGAAAIRTKQAIENARLLSRASGGGVSDADIARQQKALDLANQLAEAQRQIGFISNRAATQEQLFLLQAQSSALSLYDTERGLTEIRTRAAEQLRIQAENLKAIADAAPDDQAKQEASTSAMLQYAQAIDQADASLNRLRDAAKTAAGGIAQTIGDSIVNFKGLGSVIDSVEKQLLNIGTKVLVTDPLTKGLEGFFKGLTEGDNPVGDFFKDALGIGGGSKSGGTLGSGGVFSKAAGSVLVGGGGSLGFGGVSAVGGSPAGALANLSQAAAAASIALGGSGALGAAGGGSVLGAIGSGINGLFGKYAGTSSSPVAANYENSFDLQSSAASSGGGFLSSIGKLFSGFFADGGNIPAGKWGVVGENGPELAFGGSAGKNIVPMKRMGGGNGDGYRGGDRIVQQTNNFTIQGPVDRRTQNQLASATYAGAYRAHLRQN